MRYWLSAVTHAGAAAIALAMSLGKAEALPDVCIRHPEGNCLTATVYCVFKRPNENVDSCMEDVFSGRLRAPARRHVSRAKPVEAIRRPAFRPEPAQAASPAIAAAPCPPGRLGLTGICYR